MSNFKELKNMSGPLVRIQRVSSNIDALILLKERLGWTPGKNQIRPTAHVKNKKGQVMEAVSNVYGSPLDYLLCAVFSMPSFKEENTGKLITGSFENPEWVCESAVLGPNEFPYAVDVNTFHSVCWFRCKCRPENLSDEEISKEI